MKKLKNIAFSAIASCAAMLLITSCGADGNNPGYEYMPNMYRSPSIETYGVNEFYPNRMGTRTPVEGTIPRGFKPFEYGDGKEEYLRAGEELMNPLAVSDKVLEDGQALYEMFCMHCHGKKGDGKGSITHPIYGAIPSYADKTPNRRPGISMSELTDGHIYHTITYGFNAMGPHASQLKEEERWKIVHYVHELQSK